MPSGSTSTRPSRIRPRTLSLLDRRSRVGLFSGLYLYQGLVGGFATTALANHFAANGADAGTVGRFVALVGLPWVLQPLLWGPLLDRAVPHPMGARRVWLVRALVGAQASLCLLLGLGTAPGPSLVGAVLLLHALCASLADTATDRMIVASVPEDELGRISACTRVGFVAGGAAGAALFAWLLSQAGFAATAALLLVLTSLLALASGLVRERPEDALIQWPTVPKGLTRGLANAPRALAGHLRQALLVLRAFRDRSALELLTLCFAIDFALALFQVPFSVAMIRDHGWDAAGLSRLQAGLALLAGTLGAGLVGLLVDRTGPARALAGLCWACVAAFAAIAVLILSGLEARSGPLILGLASVIPALLYVALLPAVVLASRAQGVSATQFQIYMAAMNLGDVAGAGLAGLGERALAPALTACAVAAVFVFGALRVGSARLRTAR